MGEEPTPHGVALRIECRKRRPLLVVPMSVARPSTTGVRDEWLHRLTQLDPPPESPTLRRESIGCGPVHEVTSVPTDPDDDNDTIRSTDHPPHSNPEHLVGKPDLIESRAERGGSDKPGEPRTAVERLLPDGSPPEEVLLFTQGRQSHDLKPGGLLRSQLREAADWVLPALCHAHEDPSLKAAARQLLAVHRFTTSLDAAGWLFRDVIRPGLRARLAECGQRLATDYTAQNLGVALSSEVVARAVAQNLKVGDQCSHGHPDGADAATPAGATTAAITTGAVAGAATRNGGLTQVDVLPCDPSGNIIDFAKGWEFPDDIYAHAVLMVAAALDSSFQTAVSTVVSAHNAATLDGGTAAHHPAPLKTPARVRSKGRADYRGRVNPVSQHNIDVTRCLVTAVAPPELVSMISALAAAFPVVKVKNLFAAPEAERSERFHLLPVILTVVVDGGCCYREFVRREPYRTAVAHHVADRDHGVPKGRWQKVTAAARRVLEADALGETRVRVLGEVQLMLTAHADAREIMHEVYKAHRAESPQLLYEDFARCCRNLHPNVPTRPFPLTVPDRDSAVLQKGVEPPQSHETAQADTLPKGNAEGNKSLDRQDSVWVAAENGDIDRVEALVSSGADHSTPGPDGSAPLWVAARGGHDDVVGYLLRCGVAPDQARPDDNATALLVASQGGHADVVKTLLDHSAEVDLATSPGGVTPLAIAVLRGHTDVVRLLLAAAADVDRPRSDIAAQPLWVAAQNGFRDVVQVLLGAGAAVDLRRGDDGTTATWIAAKKGRTAVVADLSKAGADLNLSSSNGDTPIIVAAVNDHPETVAALVAAGADLESPDAYGMTALAWAERRGLARVAEILRGVT